MNPLTDKETALIRDLINAGHSWVRPIIPAIVFGGCADLATKRLMLHNLSTKGALEKCTTAFNGVVYTPTREAIALVDGLKAAERAAHLRELDRLASRQLMRVLFDEGRQLRCVREDGWRAGVRTLDRYNSSRTSISLFGPHRHIARETEDCNTRAYLLAQMAHFAPLHLWKAV